MPTPAQRMLLLMGGGKIVTPPAVFTWTLPFKILQRGREFMVSGWSINQNRPTGKTYYVSMTGDDGAAGTLVAPLRKIKTAVAKSDAVEVVILDAGPYDQDTGLAGYVITKSISIIGVASGTVISGHYSAISYAIDDPGTSPHVYHGSQAGASSWAFDAKTTDTAGDYSRLVIKTSVAEVEATTGSIYVSDPDIYIRLTDDRAPDSDVKVSVLVNHNLSFRPTTDQTIYVENCKFECGAYPFYVRCATAGKTATVYAKNCTMKYANTGGNAVFMGSSVSYIENCLAARAINDGINYDDAPGGLSAKGVEINCIGRNNGLTSYDDNGSSSHDNSMVVRIGCLYFGNVGRNIQDITGSMSWNLGVTSHTSAVGTANPTEKAANENFAIGDASLSAAGPMWLDCCRSYGSWTDLRIWTNASMYVRNCSTAGVFEGTPINY